MARRALIVAGLTIVLVFVGGGAAIAAAPSGDPDVRITSTTGERALGELTVSGARQVGGGQ